MKNNGVVFNDRSISAYIMFDELRNGPAPASTVKAAIIKRSPNIKGGFCGTIIQHYSRLTKGPALISKKIIKGKIHYAMTTAGRAKSLKRFGVMSDKALSVWEKKMKVKGKAESVKKKMTGKGKTRKTAVAAG